MNYVGSLKSRIESIEPNLDEIKSGISQYVIDGYITEKLQTYVDNHDEQLKSFLREHNVNNIDELENIINNTEIYTELSGYFVNFEKMKEKMEDLKDEEGELTEEYIRDEIIPYFR